MADKHDKHEHPFDDQRELHPRDTVGRPEDADVGAADEAAGDTNPPVDLPQHQGTIQEGDEGGGNG